MPENQYFTLDALNANGRKVSQKVAWYQNDEGGYTGDTNLLTNITIVNAQGKTVKLHYFGTGHLGGGDVVKAFASTATGVWNGYQIWKRAVAESAKARNWSAHTLQGMVVTGSMATLLTVFIKAHNEGLEEGYYDSSHHDHQHLYFPGKLYVSDLSQGYNG